ncbi:MAG TPA: phosphopantetheine-binding protein, partial [Longimicrobium sp.]|nr:phosphopantetheine-binding protein [Longimicrobium sp.]
RRPPASGPGRPCGTSAPPDPFSTEPGARMYRTGDLARWRADGAAEYLGRIDHQVKVRGFRVELGEIETVLCAHTGVRETIVLAREDAPGVARLVGYYVPTDDAVPVEALRAFLRTRLPEHMVPSALVRMDAMPLSPNGKIDRRLLPAPERGARGGAPFVAPRSEVEEILAAIWTEVLGVERIGMHDHFFDLGGYSILGVKVVSRVQEAFGVSLPLHTLFQAPTIESLSQAIARAQLEAQPEDEILRLLAELEAEFVAGG